MLGVIVGVCDFPCLILVLLISLKYWGSCLLIFFLDLGGVLEETKVENASFLAGS